MDQAFSVELRAKFDSHQLASIAANSIDADQVPSPQLLERQVRVQGDQLHLAIHGNDLFKLRTSLNNSIEAVLQIRKVIDRFQ